MSYTAIGVRSMPPRPFSRGAEMMKSVLMPPCALVVLW
jgi:hypothetical protein